MNEPDAKPDADPTQMRCAGRGSLLVNPTHPRAGLHMSQTRARGLKGRASSSDREPDASKEIDTQTAPNRTARAAAWRADEARRVAIMGEHAGTAEGIRRLVAAGELSEQAGATLIGCLR